MKAVDRSAVQEDEEEEESGCGSIYNVDSPSSLSSLSPSISKRIYTSDFSFSVCTMSSALHMAYCFRMKEWSWNISFRSCALVGDLIFERALASIYR